MRITELLGRAGAAGRSGGGDVADDGRPPPAGGWSRRQRLGGFAVATAGTLVLVATMVHAGVAVSADELGLSWQLIDRQVLADDPIGSVWHLHIQPPVHNLVVGGVLRWSPFPPIGTIVVLYLLSLWALALLLTDVLARWRVHPAVAGAAVAVALANPNLLATINIVSYEVPVATLLAASVWWFQRHLHRPGPVPLVGLATTLTLLTLTRSLFHPGFVVVVVVLAAVARPVRWRHVAVALAVPLVLVGGWMVKNQVLFGTPTLSSWLGFNLQRGVVAPLEQEAVEAAIEDGDVSELALEYPWGRLPQYEAWLDGCRPTRDHPAVTEPLKVTGGPFEVANFNHQCYLPLYEQAQANAVALVRREPAMYLRSRAVVVASSFSMTAIGFDEGEGFLAVGEVPSRTWMDDVGDVVLLPVDVTVATGTWTLPLLGGDLGFRVSITLALLAAGVLGRGTLAVVRVARGGWRDRATAWDADELVWILVAASGVLVILVGDLVEFGENGRFRSMLDPFLVALPLGAVARTVAGRRSADGDPTDEVGWVSDPPVSRTQPTSLRSVGRGGWVVAGRSGVSG